MIVALPKIPKMEHVELDHDKSMLKISFSDKETGEYPYVWLRDNCQCSTCFHPVSKSRLFLLCQLDIDVEPTKIQVKIDFRSMCGSLWHATGQEGKSKYL